MTGEYEWWPVRRLTLDPEGVYVQVIRNSYWIANDRGEVAMWRRSDGGLAPQCNTNKNIVERLVERVPGAVGTLFLRTTFSPINLNDYR